jgi:hypothetical protein
MSRRPDAMSSFTTPAHGQHRPHRAPHANRLLVGLLACALWPGIAAADDAPMRLELDGGAIIEGVFVAETEQAWILRDAYGQLVEIAKADVVRADGGPVQAPALVPAPAEVTDIPAAPPSAPPQPPPQAAPPLAVPADGPTPATPAEPAASPSVPPASSPSAPPASSPSAPPASFNPDTAASPSAPPASAPPPPPAPTANPSLAIPGNAPRTPPAAAAQPAPPAPPPPVPRRVFSIGAGVGFGVRLGLTADGSWNPLGLEETLLRRAPAVLSGDLGVLEARIWLDEEDSLDIQFDLLDLIGAPLWSATSLPRPFAFGTAVLGHRHFAVSRTFEWSAAGGGMFRVEGTPGEQIFFTFASVGRAGFDITTYDQRFQTGVYLRLEAGTTYGVPALWAPVIGFGVEAVFLFNRTRPGG